MPGAEGAPRAGVVLLGLEDAGVMRRDWQRACVSGDARQYRGQDGVGVP